jgi:isopentenyldiphosphate isomerase
MSDAFTVFIRHEEKVLLMQRADEVSDLPGAWDGIYGYGDHNDLDNVVSRIVESTGIPAEKLQHVRTGESRGIAMGNTLLEITPILFISESNDVTPKKNTALQVLEICMEMLLLSCISLKLVSAKSKMSRKRFKQDYQEVVH